MGIYHRIFSPASEKTRKKIKIHRDPENTLITSRWGVIICDTARKIGVPVPLSFRQRSWLVQNGYLVETGKYTYHFEPIFHKRKPITKSVIQKMTEDSAHKYPETPEEIKEIEDFLEGEKNAKELWEDFGELFDFLRQKGE